MPKAALFLRLLYIFALVLPLAAQPHPTPAAPQSEHVYHENFTAYTYKDQTSNVVWDIWGQQLRLRRADGSQAQFFKYQTAAAADATGGTYIAWTGSYQNFNRLYVQRLDAGGNRLWAQDYAIQDADSLGALVVDDSGNAIVVYQGPGGLRAQKLDPQGQKLWSDFTYVSEPMQQVYTPRIARAADGQVWITYLGQPTPQGTTYLANLFCQKLDANGQRLFPQAKRINRVDVKSYSPEEPAIEISGLGSGALAVWQNYIDGSDGSTYAQILDANCDPTLAQDVRLVQQSQNPMVISLSSNYAALLWGWQNQGVYLQAIDSAGQKKWPEPVRLPAVIYSTYPLAVQPADNGQALLLAYPAQGSENINTQYMDLLANKIDLSGIPLWTQPVTITTRYGYGKAALALHTDGSLLVSWSDLYSGAQQIRYERVSPAGALIPPTGSIASTDRGPASQTTPLNAQAADGTVYVAWMDNRRGSPNLYVTSYAPSGQRRWQNDLLVNPPVPGNDPIHPNLIVDPFGNLLVVWIDQQATWLQKFDPSGNRMWPDPVQLTADMAPYFAARTDLNISYTAPSQDGGLYLGSTRDGQVFIQRYSAQGTPAGPAPLRLDNTDGDTSSLPPVLAADAHYNLTIAWIENEYLESGERQHLLLQRLNPDGTLQWAQPVQVNDTSQLLTDYLALTSDPAGSTVLAWGNVDSRTIRLGKISSSGQRLWDGPEMSPSSTDYQPFLSTASDGLPLFLLGPQLHKLDASGQAIWSRELSAGFNYKYQNYGLSTSANGSILISAQLWPSDTMDVSLYQLQSDGAPGWSTPVVISDTFTLPAGFAQSKTLDAVDGNITQANLTADFDLNAGGLVFYLSNDGGQNWQAVEPGVAYRFSTAGSDLRWKVDFTADPIWPRAPIVRSLHIEYTADGPGADQYEPDDTCGAAQPIAATGAPQNHSFHQAADEDWVWFQAEISRTYTLQANQAQENIDTALQVYSACGTPPLAELLDAPGRDTQIEITAPADGPLYVRLSNRATQGAADSHGYQLSVRRIDPAPLGVIVAAQAATPEQQAALDASADRAYLTLLNAGVSKANLRYYAASPAHDIDLNGQNDDIIGQPTWETLRDAIQDWPRRQALQRGLPFYLVLVGPGEAGGVDRFQAAPGVVLTTADLDLWLDNLQATTDADQINVLIDASYSGSFITQTGAADSLAAPNRVVIASTTAEQMAIFTPQGALFTDLFFDALNQELNLAAAFNQVQQSLFAIGANQTPVMDGGLAANTAERASVAAGPAVSTAASMPAQSGAPKAFLAQMRGLQPTRSAAPVIERFSLARQPYGSGLLQVIASDDQQVTQVQVSLASCQASSTSPMLGLTSVEAHPVAGSPHAYQADLPTLKGCALLAFAWDAEGNRSAPGMISLLTARYLPLVIR